MSAPPIQQAPPTSLISQRLSSPLICKKLVVRVKGGIPAINRAGADNKSKPFV